MFNFQFSNDTQCQQFPCAYLLSVGMLCGEGTLCGGVCFDTVLAILMLFCWLVDCGFLNITQAGVKLVGYSVPSASASEKPGLQLHAAMAALLCFF